MVDDGGSVFSADAVGHFASDPGTAVAFAVGFAAYSEMLPQRAAVAFVLVEVNGAVMECEPVVFAQVGAYLFGTEFAAGKGVDVLNQLQVELIGFQLTLFGQPALLLGLFGAVLLPLSTVLPDFVTDGAFVLGQLCVAHSNLSCRKGCMLPHTGLSCYRKLHFKCESAAT